jgi:hypothetical protein
MVNTLPGVGRMLYCISCSSNCLRLLWSREVILTTRLRRKRVYA